jgi:putative transposase
MSMKKVQKRFSKAEKLKIIKEASEQGVQVTLDKHGVYPATYYSWKRKFEEMGEAGFSHGMTKEKIARIQELEQENELLKQLLAEERMSGKLKDDLLKKKYPKVKRKYS